MNGAYFLSCSYDMPKNFKSDDTMKQTIAEDVAFDHESDSATKNERLLTTAEEKEKHQIDEDTMQDVSV